MNLLPFDRRRDDLRRYGNDQELAEGRGERDDGWWVKGEGRKYQLLKVQYRYC